MEKFQKNQPREIVCVMSQADIFGDCKKRFTEKPKPMQEFLLAESFLNKSLLAYESLLIDVENLLLFNDVDAISDKLDEHMNNLHTLREDIEHCKENPADLFYNFKPNNKWKPKFRRYAKNKRTIERFG